MSTHIVLDPMDDTFVEGLVASGRFATASQAVSEALSLLQDREARLSELREAWADGCESGDWQSADRVFADLEERYPAHTKATD